MQPLLQQDLMVPFNLLLSHNLTDVKEIMMFSLSNFFMNGKKFIKAASQQSLDSKILGTLEEKGNMNVKKEAVWALATLLQYSSLKQKEEFLSNKENFRIMCQFFNQNYDQLNIEYTTKMLDCFISALEYGEYLMSQDDQYENNPYWIAISCYKTEGVLEEITSYQDKDISHKATEIIEKYSQIRS